MTGVWDRLTHVPKMKTKYLQEFGIQEFNIPLSLFFA
jgi:hypothetical protein